MVDIITVRIIYFFLLLLSLIYTQMFSPPDWTSENVNVRNIIRNINEKIYDLDPPHQRNIVHPTVWKQQLINSIFELGVIPPPFWHMRDHVYESLDGKQRIMTIYEYANNKFCWKKRKFSELTKPQKMYFLNFNVTFIYTKSTLSNEQISLLFSKFQVTKKTSAGEIINSIIDSPITNKISRTKQRLEPYFDKMCRFRPQKGKNIYTRYENIDIMFQAYYCLYINNKKLCQPAHIESFFRNDKTYEEQNFDNAMNVLEDIVDAFETAYEKDKTLKDHSFFVFQCRKTTLCPFVTFLSEDFKTGNVDEYTDKLHFIASNLAKIFDVWKPQNCVPSSEITPRTNAIKILYYQFSLQNTDIIVRSKQNI